MTAVTEERERWLRPMLVLQVAAVGLVALLLGLLAWRLFNNSGGGKLVSAIRNGERPAAPEFDLPVIWDRPAAWPDRVRPALADGRVSLDELRGTPVINFWASWCIPCREEAPALAGSARAHRDEVAFLGLDIQDFTRDARAFLRELRVPCPAVRDPSNKTYSAYGLTGVPETYYLDADGRIVGHSVGAVSRRELEQELVALAGGAP